MTQRTMEEAFNVIVSLDQNKVEAFVKAFNDNNGNVDETECPCYYDLYKPISRISYTDYDIDEEEICNGTEFYQKCMTFSDGIPECYHEFAKIVDKTGF